VLGVRVGSHTKAYPQAVLEKSGGVLTDELDGQKLVVFWYGPTRTAAAYLVAAPEADRATAGISLIFRVDQKNSQAPFVDEQTGSRWDVAGRAVDGSFKGKALSWLDSVQVRWFAWAAEYPDSAVFPAK
jgi:hypothetical protein